MTASLHMLSITSMPECMPGAPMSTNLTLKTSFAERSKLLALVSRPMKGEVACRAKVSRTAGCVLVNPNHRHVLHGRQLQYDACMHACRACTACKQARHLVAVPDKCSRPPTWSPASWIDTLSSVPAPRMSLVKTETSYMSAEPLAPSTPRGKSVCVRLSGLEGSSQSSQGKTVGVPRTVSVISTSARCHEAPKPLPSEMICTAVSVCEGGGVMPSVHMLPPCMLLQRQAVTIICSKR